MVKLHHYVPFDVLDDRLVRLIPPDASILYITKVEIRGWGDRRFGHLVLTDTGVSFRGKSHTQGLFPKHGALKRYVPYKLIVKFKNKRDTVIIKHIRVEKPKKKWKWFFKVRRSDSESVEAFAVRKQLFGDFFEELYRQATGR